MSREGKSALREIHSKLKFGRKLQIGVSFGVIASAIVEDDPINQMININTTDWEELGLIIKGINDAARNKIRTISMDMYIKSGGGDEYDFWKAMYYLCMFK